MKPDADELSGQYGLLACGSAGCWTIDLDESGEGTQWSLQLDGPQAYLAFAVDDLDLIAQAREYLRAGQARTEALPLGQFGSASVSLHWDNEDGQRCFLIVGPTARSALRLTLSAEDTKMLADAFDQIVEDLPPDVRARQ
jgi:hypothetical protein